MGRSFRACEGRSFRICEPPVGAAGSGSRGRERERAAMRERVNELESLLRDPSCSVCVHFLVCDVVLSVSMNGEIVVHL